VNTPSRRIRSHAHFEVLHVVTPARWLADDLAAGAAANQVRVHHDLGLDVPDDIRAVAWWCPGMFVARLNATRIRPWFTSPDPATVAQLPGELLGRHLQVVPLQLVVPAARAVGQRVFLKVADTKIAGLPATVMPIDAVPAFQDACYARGMGPSSLVFVASEVTFRQEHRIWVHQDEPVGSSVYLRDGITWEAMNPGALPSSSDALTFAREVTAELAGHVPDGYVLDVGQLTDGRWAVVETNPAWSSNPYWATEQSADEVVATILAAQRPGQRHQWVPDVALTRTARPLPARTERANA